MWKIKREKKVRTFLKNKRKKTVLMRVAPLIAVTKIPEYFM